MKAYKGFNRDLKCRGYQYEIGKTYECDRAKMCEEGFHACLDPLDCYGYYDPTDSRYCEVEIEDNGERTEDDTKICGNKITIVRELTMAELREGHDIYVKSREDCKFGGDYSTISGGDGSKISGGDGSKISGGDRSKISGGDRSKISGGVGSKISGGVGSNISGGDYSTISGGDGSKISGGDRSKISGGNGSTISGGNVSKISGGNYSQISCINGRARGGIGSQIVIFDRHVDEDGNLCNGKPAVGVVGCDNIKADTWYKNIDGELVEVEDDE